MTADHRVDLYAYGCVAYELLTGRPPFTDPLPQRVFAAHLAEVPKPVRDLRTDTPSALAALVMRCLEKQASQRPASADELLRSLEAVSTPSGATPMPQGSFGVRFSWIRPPQPPASGTDCT